MLLQKKILRAISLLYYYNVTQYKYKYLTTNYIVYVKIYCFSYHPYQSCIDIAIITNVSL